MAQARETRTAWSPVGAKEPFRASDRSPGTKRFLTPLRGWHLSGPLPQGLRPGLLSSAPDGAWDRAGTRLTRCDELGVEAETGLKTYKVNHHVDKPGAQTTNQVVVTATFAVLSPGEVAEIRIWPGLAVDCTIARDIPLKAFLRLVL